MYVVAEELDRSSTIMDRLGSGGGSVTIFRQCKLVLDLWCWLGLVFMVDFGR